MNHLGYISIQGNKIIFVYHELPEPDAFNYTFKERSMNYHKDCKEYEASRREVKVENDFFILKIFPSLLWIKSKKNRGKPNVFKHNQPCKAKVTDGKATIVKIL